MTTEPSTWRDRLRQNLPTALIAALIGLLLGALLFSGGSTDPQEHAHATPGTESTEATTWTCSMHPQVQSPEPGLCPICGMDLIPAMSAEASDEAPRKVTLTPQAARLRRLRTTVVAPRTEEGGGSAELRLLGRIETDESAARSVTSWIAGRIDRLRLNTTGEKISRGQVVATLYSPEVYSAHQDLLVAKGQLASLSNASEIARQAAQRTLEAARQRLKLLGFTDAEIERMEGAEAAWTQVPIRAKVSGTVLERLVEEGAYVQAGQPLYRVTDLDRLWVQLDAYESDLPRLSVGQEVNLTVSALPGEQFPARIAFIDPVIDPQTRAARVRIEVENASGRLKPGMYALATVKGGEAAGSAPPLVIPRSAPLFAGDRALVYVEISRGDSATYEAREVTLGERAGEVYPVLSGLSRGERVVTSGAFTLDADLQLRGGLGLMALAPEEDQAAPMPSAPMVTPSPEARAALGVVFKNYLSIQEHLAADQLSEVSQAATAMQQSMGAVDEAVQAQPELEKLWKGAREVIAAELARIADTTGDAGDQRAAFEPLTEELTRLLQRVGNPLDEPLRLAYCPMAFDNRGAQWLQRSETVDNAYFGEKMRRCGEITQVIEGGEVLTVVGGSSDE